MRLPAGMTRDRADALATRLSAELANEYPNDTIGQRAMLVPIWEWPYGAQTYMLPATALIGATAALLLVVVCANVAGLVLVRSVGRRGEIVARLALGAGRGRILRQLTLESLVPAVPGALAGLQLPRVAEPFIGAAASNAPLPLYFNVYTDGYVIGFAVALTCVAALAYGLGPALRLSRVDLASVLKDDLSPRGVPKVRVRTTLVVAQIATSLVLLVGTGLVLRTLDAARRADTGFDADRVTWASFDVRAGGHTERSGRQVYRQLLETIRAEPGVDAASLASYLPLTLIDWSSSDFQPEGYERRRDEDLSFAVNTVGPEYFRTMRIELAAGREFEWRDDEDHERTVIVNETLARRFWGSADAAIGKRLEGRGSRHTVVGVVHDIKYARLDEQPRPYVYLPFTQAYSPNMTLQVRASAASPDVLERIRDHARQVDPNLPVLASGAMGDQRRFAVSIYETSARVLALIGLAAAGLAGIGVYGLVAYTVKQRTHEIGIRTAVGATPGRIARQFLTRGAALGIVGVALGVIGALALTRLMSDVLYGVAATDLVSFAAAASSVLGVALIASLIPAWRAARVDPIAALRHH
jgi:predicted permease